MQFYSFRVINFMVNKVPKYTQYIYIYIYNIN